MDKRKYPFSMFLMGTILNLIKLRYCFIPVIILFILCWIKEYISIMIPFATLGCLLFIAIFQQFRIRKGLLSGCGKEENRELLDKMFADNSKGYSNVIDAVDEIIRNQKRDF